MRVVYDASAKTKQDHKSLNENLYRGPIILPDLIGLLLRFRLPPIGVISDIEKAFLNVGLQAKDRDVTRFLWLNNTGSNLINNENLQVYRFCRIPFGIISSPFLLSATINYHLKQIGSTTAEQLQRDIYVDNLITGTQSVSEGHQLYTEAKQIFTTASMNLREWASNSEELMALIPSHDRANSSDIKVLGICWRLKNDTLSVPGPSSEKLEGVFTKRGILQATASIYDPLGFFSPTILQAKIFIKELWENKFEWDTKLPTELLARWENICCDLKTIPTFHIPRYLGMNAAGHQPIVYSLICFSDASSKAYATAVYLHQFLPDTCNCSADLVFSKTHLAPQGITIPRLELLGVFIGTRAMRFIEKELHLPISAKVLWTDSQCVLQWLHSTKSLSTFVTNRLKEIKSLGGTSFKYIPTQENPADLATRGKSLSELLQSTWWNGPSWLTKPQNQWPEYNVPEVNPQAEMKSDVKNEIIFEAKLMVGQQWRF